MADRWALTEIWVSRMNNKRNSIRTRRDRRGNVHSVVRAVGRFPVNAECVCVHKHTRTRFRVCERLCLRLVWCVRRTLDRGRLWLNVEYTPKQNVILAHKSMHCLNRTVRIRWFELIESELRFVYDIFRDHLLPRAAGAVWSRIVFSIGAWFVKWAARLNRTTISA